MTGAKIGGSFVGSRLLGEKQSEAKKVRKAGPQIFGQAWESVQIENRSKGFTARCLCQAVSGPAALGEVRGGP